MRTFRPALSAIAIATAIASPAAAAPPKLPSGPGEIRLIEMDGATQERALVESAIPSAAGQPMETLQYDLNGDGNPEVVARLKGKAMCDEAGTTCRTVVLAKRAGAWTVMFDRPTRRIEARASGYGGYRQLVVDGREGYAPTADGYRYDIAANGTPVTLKPVPAKFLPGLVKQFGVGAERVALKNQAISVKVAQVSPGDAGELVLARLEGPGACGRVMGCPWRLLRVKDGAYETVSAGFSGDAIALLGVVRGGWHDIAVRTPIGVTIYGWSGRRYAVAEERKEGSAR